LEREGKRALAKRFRAFVPGRLRGDPFLPRVKLTLRGGLSVMLASPTNLHDTAKLRDAILATIEDRTFSEGLFESAYAPALAPLQQKLNERQSIRTSLSFGSRSRREVSLVIPLYAQLGFIRSQLMAFLQDPFLRDACQIIYTLDDPRLVREARTLLEGYEAWAKLDMQLLVLDRNGGYAMANNTAAEEAEGEHLVLLNSDVIPAQIGWIEAALEALRDTPNYSVVGPKLLYADDSLQHAGMHFQKFPHGYWQNLHYWKGYGREYGPATKSRPVPGVTGACMILRTSDFLDVGGFTTDYVLGDYEDSDLCLKLRERGGQCFYLASAELYHFERQSMPKIEDNHDRRSTIYNRALHTSRWDKQLASLMAEFS
jgi:GT2 family glycosyltransferase